MGKKKQQRAQQRKAQRQQQQAAGGGGPGRFMMLVSQGVELQTSGDAPAACEKFRKAVEEAPSVWTLH
jgi:hypothetical protein